MSITKSNTRMLEGTLGVDKLSATGTKDATTFLRGDNTFAAPAVTDAASNSPNFWVTTSSDQTIAGDSTVKLNYNTETLDTGNAFDTTTYKFTPQVQGTYWIYAQARFNNNADVDQWKMEIHKNGTAVSVGSTVTRTQQTAQAGSLVQFNGSTDYIEFYVYHSAAGTDITVNADAKYTYAQGFKLA